MPELAILLLGETDRTEFRHTRAVLEGLGRVVRAPDAAAAEEILRQGESADLIVAAQAFPGEFSHAAIDRLRRLAPLARVLGLLGSWCEGEMRTGKPWPAAIRVYWHQFAPRCQRELARLHGGRGSAWGLPATATEEERLLAADDHPQPARQGLIAVHARWFAMEDWLSAALRARGFSTVWLRPPQPARIEGAAAAVFDGSDLRGEEFDELKRLAEAVRPAPVIALLDFPRVEDHRRALEAGAAAVLSKPLLLDDLFWHLDRSAPAAG